MHYSLDLSNIVHSWNEVIRVALYICRSFLFSPSGFPVTYLLASFPVPCDYVSLSSHLVSSHPPRPDHPTLFGEKPLFTSSVFWILRTQDLVYPLPCMLFVPCFIDTDDTKPTKFINLFLNYLWYSTTQNMAICFGPQETFVRESNHSNTAQHQISHFCKQLTWYNRFQWLQCRHVCVEWLYKCAGSWHIVLEAACILNESNFDVNYFVIVMIWYDIFDKCNWVDTRWQ